jgi:hypothetical protein
LAPIPPTISPAPLQGARPWLIARGSTELGAQTYARVHVEGTRHVVEAAQRAGVARMALLSFIRARPYSGSA